MTIAPAPWEGNRNSFRTMQGWACKRPSAVWIIGYGLSQFVFCLFSLLLFRFSCCIYHATWALVSLKLSCSEGKTSLLSALSFWTRCHFQLQSHSIPPPPPRPAPILGQEDTSCGTDSSEIWLCPCTTWKIVTVLVRFQKRLVLKTRG